MLKFNIIPECDGLLTRSTSTDPLLVLCTLYCCDIVLKCCVFVFAEELDEVQRHHGLLRELQKLAVDGTSKILLTHFGVF